MIHKVEFWAAHVEAVRLAAVPASDYARQHGLAVKSLYYWRRKLEVTGKHTSSADHAAQPKHASKFVALQVAVPRQVGCALHFVSGLRLEMSAPPAPEWLAAFERAAHATMGVR